MAATVIPFFLGGPSGMEIRWFLMTEGKLNVQQSVEH